MSNKPKETVKLSIIMADSLAAFKAARQLALSLDYLGIKLAVKVRFYTDEKEIEVFTYIHYPLARPANYIEQNNKQR